MKTRESGMPEEPLWQGFFDPESTLKKLGLTSACQNVVDFGCGYGTFTIPAARIASGVVYALDIEREMAERTRCKANEACLKNVEVRQRDFVAEGVGPARRLGRLRHAVQPPTCRGADEPSRRGVASCQGGRQAGDHPLEPRSDHSPRAEHGHSAQAGRLPGVGRAGWLRASASRPDRLAAVPLWFRVSATGYQPDMNRLWPLPVTCSGSGTPPSRSQGQRG